MRFVTTLAWDLHPYPQILSLVNTTRAEEGYLNHNKTITVLGLGVLLAGALTLSMLVSTPDPTGLLLIIGGTFVLAVRRGYVAIRRVRI